MNHLNFKLKLDKALKSHKNVWAAIEISFTPLIAEDSVISDNNAGSQLLFIVVKVARKIRKRPNQLLCLFFCVFFLWELN